MLFFVFGDFSYLIDNLSGLDFVLGAQILIRLILIYLSSHKERIFFLRQSIITIPTLNQQFLSFSRLISKHFMAHEQIRSRFNGVLAGSGWIDSSSA